MHFEVHESLADASSVRNKVLTSQLTLPQEMCEEVYATDGYPGSPEKLARTSLGSDMVLRDGWTTPLATVVSGDVTSGYVAQLNCGV